MYKYMDIHTCMSEMFVDILTQMYASMSAYIHVYLYA